VGLVKPLGLRYVRNTNTARVITLLLLRPNPLNRINTPVDTFTTPLEKEKRKKKKRSEAMCTRKRVILERKEEKTSTHIASFLFGALSRETEITEWGGSHFAGYKTDNRKSTPHPLEKVGRKEGLMTHVDHFFFPNPRLRIPMSLFSFEARSPPLELFPFPFFEPSPDLSSESDSPSGPSGSLGIGSAFEFLINSSLRAGSSLTPAETSAPQTRCTVAPVRNLRSVVSRFGAWGRVSLGGIPGMNVRN